MNHLCLPNCTYICLAIEKHFYYLASYAEFSYEVLLMFDAEKRPVQENGVTATYDPFSLCAL